jgi:hypothetical protein
MTAPSYAELDPAIQRELLARGALLRACGPCLDELAARRTSAAVQDVLQGLTLAARVAVTAEDEAAAVRAAGEEWGARIDGHLGATGLDPAEQALLRAIRRYIRTAEAVDPFRETFDVIEERAEGLYEHNWPGATLMTTFLGAHPRGARDEYGVTAAVREAADGSAIVNLRLHPGTLGPETYAAIPAVLVHEFVCHVPARQGGVVDNESPFAEGFMDWAATYFRRAWEAHLPHELGRSCEKHGSGCFAAVATGARELAIARDAGRRAAGHLKNRLQRHHDRSDAQACAEVASLAIQLNVTEARLTSKDAFVAALDAAPDVPVPRLVLDVLKGSADAADLL